MGQQALRGGRAQLPEEACHADIAPLVSGVPAPGGLFNAGDRAVLMRMLREDLRFGMSGNQFNIGDTIGEGEAHHETV